jgi:hypothetical protein
MCAQANFGAMNAALEEISRFVNPGDHVLDLHAGGAYHEITALDVHLHVYQRGIIT